MYILISGNCFSAATYIALSVPYERRYAIYGSSFLIHQLRFNIENADYEKVNSLLIDAHECNSFASNLYNNETKISKETIDAICSGNTKDYVFRGSDLEKFEIAHTASSLDFLDDL